MNLSTALPPRCSPCSGCVLLPLDTGLPLPEPGQSFCFHISAASGISKADAHLSFHLSSVLKNIREKERCVLLSSPAAARGAPKPSSSKPKGSQSSCSSILTRAKLCACSDTPGQSSAQLSPSHSLPAPTAAFILLMQIHEKLHKCRELHYAGDVTAAAPALHEE